MIVVAAAATTTTTAIVGSPSVISSCRTNCIVHIVNVITIGVVGRCRSHSHSTITTTTTVIVR